MLRIHSMQIIGFVSAYLVPAKYLLRMLRLKHKRDAYGRVEERGKCFFVQRKTRIYDTLKNSCPLHRNRRRFYTAIRLKSYNVVIIYQQSTLFP